MAQSTTAPRWTFITNHGLVLAYIFHNPSHTAREIALHVGVTERTTHKIISDLDAEGYITRRKSGRRNLYEVDPALPLRHHTKQDVMVEDLLHVLSTQGTKELRESAETMSKA
jgi:DNA-binding MarR family transcriptional regulator